MAVKRLKEISLRSFDPRWSDHDSKIIVSTRGFNDVIAVYKNEQKQARDITKLEREIKKVKNKIQRTDDESIDELYEVLDDLQDKMDALSLSQIEYLQSEIKERFEKGLIYDADMEQSRDMVIEDIEDLDAEVVSFIARAVFGTPGNS